MLAFERVAKKRFDLLESIANCSGGQVKLSGRRGHVLAGIEESLQSLNQLASQPALSVQWA